MDLESYHVMNHLVHLHELEVQCEDLFSLLTRRMNKDNIFPNHIYQNADCRADDILPEVIVKVKVSKKRSNYSVLTLSLQMINCMHGIKYNYNST